MKDVSSDASAGPKTLEFSSDKGASRSTWIAGAIVVVLVGWMGSGFVLPNDANVTPVDAPEIRPVAVAVVASQSQPVTQYFQAEGQALPDRDTALRAETSGEIAEVLVSKGDDLSAGQVIARFDVAERQADLVRAQEEVTRTEREFANAETLLQRGTATVDRVADTRAALAAAQAQLSAAEQAMQATEIVAPFDGRLESLSIDPGEYVQSGADVGRIVDNTPLSVSIQIPQQALHRVAVGQSAEVRFITGDTAEGIVSFVGTNAAADTRTFLAEVEVENADGSIPAGISAQVRIPTGQEQAHFLSPAILSLGTDGTLGVKTVDAENVIAFNPVNIARAQTDGVWVTGLPDEAMIVTVGQGFVSDGETVAPQVQEAAK